MNTIIEPRRKAAAVIAKPGSLKPKISLVCFHHAGGNALPYLSWRPWLPEDVALYCVQLSRPRTNTAEPSVRVNDVRQTLFDTKEIWEADHVIMFGHSLGGLLAYTIAAEIMHETPHIISQIIASASVPKVEGIFDSKRSGSEAGYFELLYDLIYLGGVSKELMSDSDLLDEAILHYREDLALLEYIEANKPHRINSELHYFFPQGEGIDQDAATAAWKAWSGDTPFIHLLDGGHFYFARDEEIIKSELLQRILSCNLD